MKKKKKTRVELRKNRTKPPRDNSLTQDFQSDRFEEDQTVHDERVRAKGEVSRYRTIVEDVPDRNAIDPKETSCDHMPSVDADCLPGRVLRVHGLQSVIESETGQIYRCTVRRLLKNLSTEERSILTTGDQVWFRPSSHEEGVVERIEPRRGVLTRASKRREHVLVANVDQIVVVISLVEPDLKVHLIDRYLASAQMGKLNPIICLNKADRVEAWRYQSLIGAYSQLGIPILLTSAVSGEGIDPLRQLLTGRATVFSGQSGVGKSSLLNAIQPGLALRVKSVSEVNQKGRHTTTTAEFIRLPFGGWVVDTPGVRQLQLWNIIPDEVEGFFPEFRSFIPLCGFPDCTHTHEIHCAVKSAVDRHWISARRYHSYCGMFEGSASDGM